MNWFMDTNPAPPPSPASAKNIPCTSCVLNLYEFIVLIFPIIRTLYHKLWVGFLLLTWLFFCTFNNNQIKYIFTFTFNIISVFWCPQETSWNQVLRYVLYMYESCECWINQNMLKNDLKVLHCLCQLFDKL